jgi:hypothetical protein
VVDEIGLTGPGVVTADAPGDVPDDLLTLLSLHRAWERYATSV